ncbi:transposase [Planococcus shenhongbingii]|uniref:Transposase n=1 Tax=Planococcus shenhongbingii TaxID=3058398 RepID=A0ABT8NGP0_9BACL|nr:transposase [Planococcus sp. N017]MDN7247075.1 transposase [Planococcus sp. N017]
MAKFTVKDKLRATRESLDSQETKKEMAKRYGVNAKELQQWIELYRHHREDGSSPN